MKKTTRIKKWIIVAGILLSALIIACAIYLNDYYHAAQAAFAATGSSSMITVETRRDGSLVFRPKDAKAGLIFYPGGKVEYTAYAPLMQSCAERGILCVLIKMPGNLAVLDQNAADGIPADFPEVADWYIGGHSLGGAMAASYAAEHTENLRALVLLAAYSTKDISNSGLKVLCISGSADGVLDRNKYEKYRKNLPQASMELVIQGGCHSGFGCYGPQDGDGTPSISAQEQIVITADAIAQLINEE